ncbi:PEP-CTERM sorting domain-containing protein [Cerasicoccus arenae]|uniref:PEP-CTERM sorting domain-containing protein n=1 Tax=Cerasicoccus arenae TaxID=424488 RepID=A0A8J3DCS4_9BACT|nr:PEP-CTERM sorting domain-containing protein [Cerasicoccus arenae]MBK1858951.1 PEP-CTERM sorting domain-containing protein [Cerasicoccus arenae]GHC04045.1 hypothetical protein GCM10007047_20860 [Cerasicoccus arenae]
MKRSPFTAIVFALTCTTSFASVTFSINKDGLQNASGTATNGMSFGFIVDTSGTNTFDLGNYTAWDITTNGQFLSLDGGNTFTDDWFVYGGTLGSSQTPPQTQNGSLFGFGDGTVLGNANIQNNNISNGNQFVLVWFPSENANTSSIYGAAGDNGSNMVVPPNGFSNTPPSALNTLTPSFTVAAVPEPSTYAAIFGVAMLLYAGKRRHK